MTQSRSLNKEGPASMVNHLERSPAFRRWLSIAVALVLSAGVWAVSGQDAFAETVVVRATNFTFTPQDITIQVGDTVTWVNEDAESHAAEGGSLSSPEIRAGESFSHTFTAPEEISYVCRFHTYITGTISVVAPDAPTTTAPPTTAPPTTVPPTTAPPPTVEPAPTEATTPTTAAPAPVRPTPSGTRGTSFQDVPDDPSARKPPGELRSSPSAKVVDPTTSDTPATTSATTPATTPPVSSGAGSGGSTTPTTRSSGFQDVPHDPSASHAPGQLLSAATDEGDPPGDSSPPTASAGGTPLGDGTVLAPFTSVNGVKEFHLTMSETTVEVSPGVTKQAYAFNGVVPGPVIRVDEGDRVRIVVDNQLPFPTSTHWHGMILPNDQDGVGGITQPHIEAGAQYVYEWTAVATGTHWYHAHSSGRHIGKGLYGMLEVVPDEGDFEADRDYRLMLGDTDLGFTINGRSFPSTPVLDAAVGETVRLRLVNTGDQVHAFHLHGVPFKVVAQDGMKREQPVEMDTLTISPGQTYDLIFAEVYPGKWVMHCHMFVHSHMTDDVHPPGESGMNGMTALMNITPDSTPDAGGAVDGLLAISSADGSDPDLLVLVAIGGLLVVAERSRRRRRRTVLSTPKS